MCGVPVCDVVTEGTVDRIDRDEGCDGDGDDTRIDVDGDEDVDLCDLAETVDGRGGVVTVGRREVADFVDDNGTKPKTNAALVVSTQDFTGCWLYVSVNVQQLKLHRLLAIPICQCAAIKTSPAAGYTYPSICSN